MPELIGSPTDRTTLTEAALRQRGVAPQFFPGAFTYAVEQNHYLCPEGKRLPYEGREKQNGSIRYRYRAAAVDCQNCPFQQLCCPNSRKGRSLVRTEEAPVMAAFKAKMATEAAHQIYKQRAGVADSPMPGSKTNWGCGSSASEGGSKWGSRPCGPA